MMEPRGTVVLLVASVLALALVGATSHRSEALTPKTIGVPVGDSAQKLLDRAVAYLVVRAYADALSGMQSAAKPLCSAINSAALAKINAAINTQLKSVAPKHVEGIRTAATMLVETLQTYVTSKHCVSGTNPAVTDLAALKAMVAQLTARLGVGLAVPLQK